MTWIRRCIADPRARGRGQTLVIFVLVFTVLMGFAGLALDATHQFLVQHAAQKAADAAVLAAGKRLAGSTWSGPPSDTDFSSVAAHDFAAVNGFTTNKTTTCVTTSSSGGLNYWTDTWYDVAGLGCPPVGTYNTSVSIAVPPTGTLTPHCATTPYNCMQITITQQVTNYVMPVLGFPKTLVSATATAFAQPNSIVYSTPSPFAVYLYEQAVANISSCPVGQQCFDRTKGATRSLLSCSSAGANCPTLWEQNGAGTMFVGVDGQTLNPPQDVVALESNGDMVLNDSIGTIFCDPNGGQAGNCLSFSAVGSKGYALATGAIPYCDTSSGSGNRTPIPCTKPGPGGSTASTVIGNETGWSAVSFWSAQVNTSGLASNCGTVVLNGDTVAASGGNCNGGASEPYTLTPGVYNSIVVNHGAYTFEPGIYDITGVANVNTATGGGYANGIDHGNEGAGGSDWDLCPAGGSSTACGGATPLTAGVWIGYGKMAHAAGGSSGATCGGSGSSGGGGDLTSITGHGVTFKFEPASAGFVSTGEVSYIALTSPGLGQEARDNGAPILFDMENGGFIHLDASSTRGSSSNQLNTFQGIIYQSPTYHTGGVEVNPGSPTRLFLSAKNSMVTGQIFAYSLTMFGNYGAFDFSNGTGGAATPTGTTSGNLENQILQSSTLVAGPTSGTESLVVKYTDEWAMDAYDVYVKVNAGPAVYFSEGIWNPAPTGTLPPNGAAYTPSDTHPAYPTNTETNVGKYSTHGFDSAGDPNYTITYPSDGDADDGSTFNIDGDWIWGHERDISTAKRGNDLATLTYTFPVPTGTTVTVSMFMTDGDRCGDYVTATWTFNNIGTPSGGVQIIGSVRLEQ
jgi:hypothetical protein